jgi:hypothetical protein
MYQQFGDQVGENAATVLLKSVGKTAKERKA